MTPPDNERLAATARREASIELAHQNDGKPVLVSSDDSIARALEGVNVSLADGGGCSVAFVAPGPIGVDLERVVNRDAETWRGLLGDDGYALALRVTAETAESFDTAATRVWTLLEAGKKANGLKRFVPRYDSARGGPWHGFVRMMDGLDLEYLCATVRLGVIEPSATNRSTIAALAVVVKRRIAAIDSSVGTRGARHPDSDVPGTGIRRRIDSGIPMPRADAAQPNPAPCTWAR